MVLPKLYLGCGKKKLCMLCGCILHPDSESDICECCLDELYESDPGRSVED